MALLATDLLADAIDALKAPLAHERTTYTSALSARDDEIERLRAQLRLLLAQRFSAKSERVEGDSPQRGLFDEAEVEAAEQTNDDAAEITTVAGHTRARGHRRALPAQLPREEVVHDLAEADKTCPHDGTRLGVMVHHCRIRRADARSTTRLDPCPTVRVHLLRQAGEAPLGDLGQGCGKCAGRLALNCAVSEVAAQRAARRSDRARCPSCGVALYERRYLYGGDGAQLRAVRTAEPVVQEGADVT